MSLDTFDFAVQPYFRSKKNVQNHLKDTKFKFNRLVGLIKLNYN